MNIAMKEEKTEQEGLVSLQLPAGDSSLCQLIDFISSLVSLSHSVKVFPVKWQLIRAKLERLNSGLTAAENCNSGESQLFCEVIQSVFRTVSSCHDLAHRCINLSYSGKLLMQSDLDVVLANFDRHINELARVYTTGILKNTQAIVVSKPAAGAGSEDMKFYVTDLLTRLKIGDFAMKHQALVALNACLIEDDKNVRVVVNTGEMVNLLVKFLEYEEVRIQEESAEAISVISSMNSFRGVLMVVSVIAPLIRVIELGSELGKQRAAKALQNLTENSENAWSVSAHGGVTVLLKICCDYYARNEQLTSCSCCILSNLAGVEEIRRFMIEEGAISVFIKLSCSEDEVLRIHAIEFLQNIASSDESVRLMILRKGGMQSLIGALDPQASVSSKMRDVALRAIDNLCLVSNTSINFFVGSNFLNLILFFMQNGDISTQELAAKTAFRLCSMSADHRKAMGDVGFLSEFVKLLGVKSPEIREQAAEALLDMVLVPKNRKLFIRESSYILHVLQAINPEDENSGNSHLLSLLLSLTYNSTSARRKIASSGYIKHLEKLANSGSTKAKKIIKKLSENRLRTILSGIWNAQKL